MSAPKLSPTAVVSLNPMVRATAILFTTAALLLITGTAAAQGGFDDVEIETSKLADGIYMLTGAGGNMGLSIGDDGAFLIDDQFAPLTEKIQAAISAIGPQPVRFVLNTHWHGDHTGGNENFGKAGTLIVAHGNVRKRMMFEGLIGGREVKASPPDALPVVTFSEDVTFHLNGETIKAVHVPPAHTDGDSVVHFANANVIHMGDLFFNGRYPFVDVDSGGSIDGLIAAVERVLGHADDKTQIIPGHGPLASRKDLAAYHTLLTSVRLAVAAHVTAGKTLEETVAAKPTAAFDEDWSWGFIDGDRITTLVYRSLSEK